MNDKTPVFLAVAGLAAFGMMTYRALIPPSAVLGVALAVGVLASLAYRWRGNPRLLNLAVVPLACLLALISAASFWANDLR